MGSGEIRGPKGRKNVARRLKGKRTAVCRQVARTRVPRKVDPYAADGVDAAQGRKGDRRPEARVGRRQVLRRSDTRRRRHRNG